MKKRLRGRPGPDLVPGHRGRFSSEKGRAAGIRTIDGHVLRAKAVIVTPGTFLNGLIHIGLSSYPAGRANEPPSHGAEREPEKAGLADVPPQDGDADAAGQRTIDWTRFEPQPGDDFPVPFSFRTTVPLRKQGPLPYRLYEREDPRGHPGEPRQIPSFQRQDHRDRAPLLSLDRRQGRQVPPSCPPPVLSRARRAGLRRKSTSTAFRRVLPFEIQKEILKTIPGLDRAKILRPAYGIEYDAVAPDSTLDPTLESKIVPGSIWPARSTGRPAMRRPPPRE